MSSPPQTLPLKKDVALFLLQGTSMFVHLDPRKPEVIVPDWFRTQPNLILQLGLNMAVQIPDLSVDDQCVSGTLSFNRAPFFCRIPWAAVFALVGENGRGMVWPTDVPSEVAAQMVQVRKPRAEPKPKKKSKRRAVQPKRPKKEAPATEAPNRPLPPYLRVIK